MGTTTTAKPDPVGAVARQARTKRVAQDLLKILLPPPPALASTLARYREAGLLTPSRKGARHT
jgi:hypothetical protein